MTQVGTRRVETGSTCWSLHVIVSESAVWGLSQTFANEIKLAEFSTQHCHKKKCEQAKLNPANMYSWKDQISRKNAILVWKPANRDRQI